MLAAIISILCVCLFFQVFHLPLDYGDAAEARMIDAY